MATLKAAGKNAAYLADADAIVTHCAARKCSPAMSFASSATAASVTSIKNCWHGSGGSSGATRGHRPHSGQ